MAVRIGVVAVGGKGIRFARNDIQKCLVSIEGKPILEYAVQALAAAGVNLVFLLTGFLHEQVTSHLTSGFGTLENCTIASVYGGIAGEAPAICCLRPFLQEDFIYAGGDVIPSPESVTSLIAEAENKQDSIAIMTVSHLVQVAPEHPRTLVDPSSMEIQRLALCESERQSLPLGPVGAGLYYFRPDMVEYLSQVQPNRPVSESLRFALNAGRKVTAYETPHPWFALHTEDDLLSWQDCEMRQKLLSS